MTQNLCKKLNQSYKPMVTTIPGIPGLPIPLSVFKKLEVPMILQPIPCGFPSPAQDYLQKVVDLNDVLIKNPPATFIFIAEGNSMLYAGIVDGALLLVDRSIPPKHLHIVLAVVDGAYTVKQLNTEDKCLVPANPDYEPIWYKDGMELEIWGVVTNIIINPYKSYVRTSRL